MTEADRKRAYRSLLQGLIEEEKRRWLALLQGPVPLTRKQMQELANRLEQTWFPKRGRRSVSEWNYWEIGLHNLEASRARLAVFEEIHRMEERGERPRGGRRLAAEVIVAERYGIGVRALQDRMRYMGDPRNLNPAI
jgi:hypothetical protein